MECDIHLFAEVKIKGKWHLHNAPSMARSYATFEKMAGVRGNVCNAISAPKGLPDDLSEITQLHYDRWKLDAHSASWLNSKEIEQLEKWLVERNKDSNEYFYPEKIWGYVFGGSWGGFHKYGASDQPEVEDVRFVFWFDN